MTYWYLYIFVRGFRELPLLCYILLAKIQISPKGEGISVFAPSLGLNEVYIDRNTWKVWLDQIFWKLWLKTKTSRLKWLYAVSFELNLQVQVVDWMKGQTCGLCGKADGEIRQEYHMPSGHMAKNAVTYAHSWILGAKSCRDNSGETQEGSKEHWRAHMHPIQQRNSSFYLQSAESSSIP